MVGAYVYTPDIWPPLAAASVLAVLGLYCWLRRSVPGALPLAASSFLAALVLLAMAPQAAAVTPATKIAWYKFEAVWLVPFSTILTCFVLEYTYPGRWLTRRNLILLSIPPLLVFLLIIVDGSRFMWRELEIAPNGAVAPTVTAAGAIAVAYGLGLGLINAAALTWLFIRSPQHRWPAVLILLGMIAGRGAFLLHLTHSSWATSLDPFFVALLLPWMMYAAALFGFRIFDPQPAACSAAMKQMQEGMVILDAQGRIASLNPAAATMLSISAAHVPGKTLQELLPVFPRLVVRPAEAGSHVAALDPLEKTPFETEISLGTGDDVRIYELELSVLEDFRGLLVGRLLMLRDVTERRRAQAQTLERQRMLAVLQERERLARELHDNLGQVFAFVNSQGQAVRRLLARGEIAAADEHAARLVEVAREADTDIRESILGLRVTLANQGLGPALASYLDQYEQRYGIHTELKWPEALGDGAFEPLVEVQLLRIVQEALTNARKHACARSVCVTVAAQDGRAQVTVQDDGCGFDLGETMDDAASHVGLRVMCERAEEIGGTLVVQSTPNQGTQVVVIAALARRGGDAKDRQGDGYARTVG